MIDASRLLEDLKRLRRGLDADLRDAHAAGPGRDAVRAEWQAALDAGRTRETFETFFDASLDQAGVHWVLACVFLRFLEDNGLIDPPMIGGPQDRLELARERHAAYFRAHPHQSDLDWLLALFGQAAQLPGLAGLFDPAHNPLFRLPVSGDGAGLLRAFFQKVVPETGAPVHDFTDPTWDTRFLGDLYQDLSELARKRYALLQTPEFIEAWILDRTLEPAIKEFGFREVRMIDPACGSGHFLLGGFQRLLREWQVHEPDMPAPAQARRALDAVAGVDLNPFAVEVARFRLLLAALRASGVHRLRDAPDFPMNLAVGDSLLHGRHFARQELGGAAEGFGRVLHHHYKSEDTTEVDRILGRQYHAVVGNPPYITPKDPAMRDAYREIYTSCHMKYGLGEPFTERFFDLARAGTQDQEAGFVGLIVDNSFMKREHGKKLIEQVLAGLDLTHVVSCSGVPLPGHNTSTVILFGRNRAPVASTVRTVRGIKGDPDAVADPSNGQLWKAILVQTDQARSESAFISTEDTSRAVLARHPWNMGGGGAGDVQGLIEGAAVARLEEKVAVRVYTVWIGNRAVRRETREIGVFGMTNADEVMLADERSFLRASCEASAIKPLVLGDTVRDWKINECDAVIFPYTRDELIKLTDLPNVGRWLWPARTTMGNRATFSQRTYFDEGRPWWEWHQVALDRLKGLTITFGEIATHNHFALERGGKVFKQAAPVIKLPAGASEDDHLGLLGLLNSSTACFWLKARCKDKGGDHVGTQGARIQNLSWDERYAFNATNVAQFPLPTERPLALARALETDAQRLSTDIPAAVSRRAVPTRAALDAAQAQAGATRARMIASQEELDWLCYRLYGLHETPPEHPEPPPQQLGERAFEIVMARQIAAGTLDTAWFVRHGSAPITDLPAHWPSDYRDIVERRIALIETDPVIGLIERSEYKRRWSTQSWAELEQAALQEWLLDRLEAPALWPASAELLTTNQITDRIHEDADFLSVAALYRGRDDYNLEALVAELIAPESVPFHTALRYTEIGRRKRAQWEETWRLQRQEDAIDAEAQSDRPAFLARVAHDLREARRTSNPPGEAEAPEAYDDRIATSVIPAGIEREADRLVAVEQKRRKQKQVGAIPVPPKYISKDFQGQDYWRLRGGLDVPKERFVSFPGCSPDADGSLLVTWAGYDHLARALAIGSFFQTCKDELGWPAERLIPLLGGLHELLPWLLQWHNGAEGGQPMGDYFTDMVRDEALALNRTVEDIAAWTPPARPTRGRRRAAP